MALPTTRTELRQYCKERCGDPVITINIADIQIDHAIDDAVDLFLEYHYDGTRRTYIAHEITATDIANRYITLDDNVLAVTRVLKASSTTGGFSGDVMFSPEYQLRLNDLYDLSSANLSYYTIAQQYIATLNDILSVETRFAYTRYENKLYMHDDWLEYPEGSFLVAEAHILQDETLTNGKIYSGRIVRSLAAAYTKLMWGENLSKFEGVTLPGGVTLNANTIIGQAEKEIEKLENEIQNNIGPDSIQYG